jgi:hypothetical protein
MVHVLYVTLGTGYGGALNVLDVYSYALAPIAMLVLLRELRVSRIGSACGGAFLLFNPVTLWVAAPGYVSWSLFFILGPLALTALVRYDRTNDSRFLALGLLVSLLLILLDPVVGPRLIAPLIAGVLILPFATRRVVSLRRMAWHYVLALSLFAVLWIGILSLSSGQLDSLYSLGSTTASSFYHFHLSNVKFTYQSQGLFNSLAALNFYPGSELSNLGYPGTLAYWIWFVVIIASICTAALRRHKEAIHFKVFLISAIALVGFQVGVSTGLLDPIFSSFPPLFDYEYPSVMNFIQIVFYAALFGLLVDTSFRFFRFTLPEGRRNRVVLSLGTQYAIVEVGTRSPSRKPRHSLYLPALATVISVVVVLTMVNAPGIAHARSEAVNPTENSQNYLPAFYNNLASYFAGHQGDYRILPLPLNYTTIIQLYSAVPVTHIFGIPYAGLNSPGTYPNSTLLLSALTNIASNKGIGFAQELAHDNVRYVLVLNPVRSAKIQLSSTFYNSYINGGGRNFVNFLERAGGFAPVVDNSNYMIFENQHYIAPVVAADQVVSYEMADNASIEPTDLVRNLTVNSTFSGSGGWGHWTSCEGPQSNFIRFSNRLVTLSTCSGSNATGVETHTPQTEIYQLVPIVPGAELSVSARATSYSSGLLSFIVIFHNESNLASFYTSQQYFPAFNVVPHHTLSFTVTAPPGAIAVNVGINLLNSSGEVANVSLNLLEGSTVLTRGTSTAYTNLPMLSGDGFAISTGKLPPEAASLFPAVREYPPAWLVSPNEFERLLGSTPNGTIYLSSGVWNLTIPCAPGSSFVTYLWLSETNTSINLSSSRLSYGPYESGWASIPVGCLGAQETNVTLRVTGSGYAAVLGVFLYLSEHASPPLTSGIIETEPDGSIRVTSTAAGILALYTVESFQVSTNYPAKLLYEVPMTGATLIIFNVTGVTTLYITLDKMDMTSTLAAAMNLLVMILTIVMIFVTAVYGINQRVKMLGVRFAGQVIRRTRRQK